MKNRIINLKDLDYWIKIALNYPVAISNQTTLIYNFKQNNNSISKINIEKQKLINFEKYRENEKENPHLKRLLDIYRIEYALHFHICGNKEKRDYFLENVTKQNVQNKMKLLLKTPPFILRKLLYIKRYLKKFGIDFTVYH